MQLRKGRSTYVGKCIYCGSTENLTDEHAIPFALKGIRILAKGSCLSCNAITTRFERSILRNSMLAIRTVLGLPTRRKRSRPQTLPLIFVRGNSRTEEQVPISDSIPAFVLPELGPPEIYPEIPHRLGMVAGSFIPKVHFPVERASDKHLQRVLDKYSADGVELPWEIHHGDFRRLLAKIAMCEAIGLYGLEQFKDIYVTTTVLGRDRSAYFVGSDGDYDMHAEGGFEDSAHVIAAIRPRGTSEVWIRIKLWNKSITLEYTVVVGRLRTDYARFLDAHGLIV